MLSINKPTKNIYHIIPNYTPIKFTHIIMDYDKFPILNQTITDECVAYGCKFLAEYLNYKNNKNIVNLSTNSIYYLARRDDTSRLNDNADIGTGIYYGIRSLSL